MLNLIENMNICYNQKTPTATPMSPHEAMAAALAEQQWPISKQSFLIQMK